MGAALPASLKLASETKVILQENLSDLDESALSQKEHQIVDALMVHGELDIKEISEILGQATVLPHVNRLVKKGWVTSFEEMKQKFKPKTEKRISLTSDFQTDEALEILVERLESGRGTKKLEAVLGLLREIEDYQSSVSRKKFLEVTSVKSHTIKALIEDEVFRQDEVQLDPFAIAKDQGKEVTLTEIQQNAFDEIEQGFATKDVCLLHGVTGSGKTEIYIECIKDQLASGFQCLLLIPEIGLTTQLIQRLEAFFPGQLLVYHSKFNMRERTEVWNEVLGGAPKLVIGARSSVFLPFQNLGLLIVDEEHESSFKQQNPAPRYHARDAAIVLASMHKAKTLLGSATPSIESYWNAKEGKYGLVALLKRHGNMMLPEIMTADIKKELKRKSMQGHFSYVIREEMERVVREEKQIILFQNRRGYAPLWQCHTCGHVPKCTRCDVSLTYHKFQHHLSCHYCGYTIPPPKQCSQCGSSDFRNRSFGTEMIEEELNEFYPDWRAARMDLDTTRSKNAYQKILERFDHQEIDVLVGTQMVSKGLDFDHVQLVGILNADSMLKYPDFRALERSYQMMVQVAGRAGRRGERGKVVIQTYDPDHWIIQKVIAGDYKGMFEQELIERKQYHYPPFYRLIQITLKHKVERVVHGASHEFAEWLRASFNDRVLGPETPHIARINNQYIRQILVKLERDLSPTKLKKALLKLQNDFKAQPNYKSVRIILDVDPY